MTPTPSWWPVGTAVRVTVPETEEYLPFDVTVLFNVRAAVQEVFLLQWHDEELPEYDLIALVQETTNPDLPLRIFFEGYGQIDVDATLDTQQSFHGYPGHWCQHAIAHARTAMRPPASFTDALSQLLLP